MLKENKAHLTAITRKTLSKPMQYLVEQDLIKGNALDYGCGKGFDCDALGISGYDPFHRQTMSLDMTPDRVFNTIACNYVLNVIPDEQERKDVIEQIKTLLTDDGIAYISVRNDVKELNGYTSKGTWQGHILLDLPIVKKTSNFIMYKVTKN